MKILTAFIMVVLAFTGLTASQFSKASTYELPTDGSSVVGAVQIVAPGKESTLVDIARHFDLGYHEITWANPDVDVWYPGVHVNVVVPTEFILPPKPWKGVVVNISARRLFYFLPAKKGKPKKVITLPISIAREGWSTPLGKTRITGKHRDPGWFVPESIRREHAANGDTNFPKYVPPGPNNPMGMLAVQTGFDGIFIHGTNRPWGVGMRTSHGCLHLYPEDASTFFAAIPVDTSVRMIDQPLVVGKQAGRLVMTSYEPVTEYGAKIDMFSRAVMALNPYLYESNVDLYGENLIYDVDWAKVRQLTAGPQVVPVDITIGGAVLEDKLAKIDVDLYNWPPYDVGANDARPPGEAID